MSSEPGRFVPELTKGILRENPTFVQVLGMCPALAVTNSVLNGLVMGAASTFVLVMSSLMISALRKRIPSQVRISTYVVVIATFVTVADFSLQALLPAAHHEMAAFISLIVVNCLILGRAEAFASRNPVLLSIADALGMGAGFSLALVLIGAVREVLGSGTFFGLPVFGAGFEPWVVMVLPPGGFLVLGVLLLGLAKLAEIRQRAAARAAAGGSAMSANLLTIFVSALLVNNFTLSYFLGLCPFFGVSGRLQTAFRLGVANTFVLIITSVATWTLNTYVLVHAPYLALIAYILVIASTVQFVEMVIKKTLPALFRALGIYLPLITTNCAILGLALFQTSRGYGLLEGLVFAIGAGLGLMLALVLMAGLREEAELSNTPRLLRGTAMSFLIAGILSLAFMGFAGLFGGS